MRWLGELALLAVAIGIVVLIGRGIAPVAPALATFLRAVLHPIVLLALFVLFLLLRIGRSRRQHPKTRHPPIDPA